MKRSNFVMAVAYCLFFAATPPRAQNPPADSAPRSPIASLKVSGLHKFPADQVVAASGLKAGDVVTAAQIQDATNRLAALGVFSAVNFHYTTAGSAINLEFQVQEAPTYPIVFDNIPWFTSEEMGDAIRKQVGLFTGESPDGGTMVDAMTDVIEDLLDSKHIKGEVTHQLLSAAIGDQTVMQFRLEGAAALRVQSVEFGDPLATNSAPFRERVSDIRGQPYSLFAAEIFDYEQVRPLYEAKGLLRAKIGPPQAHLVPDTNDPEQSAVDLTIPIAPGPVYSWKSVSWQGNQAIPGQDLDSAVDLKPGDIADGMKIEAQWQKVEKEYGQRGYIDMKLSAEPQFDDNAHQVSYRVKISEGSQYHMGQLVITGLSVEGEKRLREAWQIAPGQIFDDAYYEMHMKMLAKPSRDIFGSLPVHYNEFGHFLRPDTTQHTVDLLMDFK